MHIGFSVLEDAASMKFCFFGCSPSNRRSAVTFMQTENGCAALMGRLHYRDEIALRLSGERGMERRCSDAELAWAAYDRWGIQGIARLEGDFCLVIWDRQRDRLLAARDPLGRFPLFWTRHQGIFAASTAMATLPNISSPALNLDFIADYLSQPYMAIQERPFETSVWQGIQRVVPGVILMADLHRGVIRRQPCWNWLEHMVEPDSDRVEDIAEDFSVRVRRAVRERLEGITGAHLSGGVDSTSVALVARDCLCSGSAPSPLHTFSLTYERMTTLRGETAFIDAALAQPEGIIAHRIAADELLPYDGLLEEPNCDEPFADLLDLARDQVILDKAMSVGVKTLLTGHGGDDVFEVPPFHISELLRAGEFRTAWREASGWSRGFKGDPWHVLYRYGLANLIPVRFRAGLRSLVYRGQVDWQHQGDGTIAPWLSRSFVRRYHIYERTLAQLRGLHGACRPVGLSMALAAIQAHVGNARCWALGMPRDIMIAHPLTDVRVLCLGLGVRLRYRQEPGKHKPLFTCAMREILPETIRERRAKNHFNEVHYRGLARNIATLERLIRRSRVAEIGLFDSKILSECLRRASLGDDKSYGGAMRLDLALALVKWLALREKNSPVVVAAAESIRVPRAVEKTMLGTTIC